MNTPDQGNFLNTANILRIIYGPHAKKKIARAHGISDETAKKWLADGIPPSRIYRMTAQLREDIARHLAEVERVQHWIEKVGAGGWRGCASGRPGQSIEARFASSDWVPGLSGSEVGD